MLSNADEAPPDRDGICSRLREFGAIFGNRKPALQCGSSSIIAFEVNAA